jgi:ribonuclease BN (tRNA processing enzyme)
MRVQVLSCGGATPGHPLTAFLLDGVLAVDAGPLGTFDTVAEQGAVRDILLTHSHIDHVAGLPVFLDTVYQLGPPPAVHATRDTLDSLRKDVFNDRLMPDFLALSESMTPFLTTREVEPHRPFAVGRYTVTAIPVDHTVPTVAYLIDDRTSAVAVVTDTAPVPGVIEPLAGWPRLKAVFLECSYPRRLTDLAGLTKHLTTDQFAEAALAFPQGVRVLATHVKPRYHAEVQAELEDAGFEIAEPGRVVDV